MLIVKLQQTIAIAQCRDKYDEMKCAFADVFRDVNALIKHSKMPDATFRVPILPFEHQPLGYVGRAREVLMKFVLKLGKIF